jgi:hypothetical protein
MDQQEIRDAILHYLKDHPHAQDTLEGIARWWVPATVGNSLTPTLKRVIYDLCNDGILTEKDVGSVNRLFCMKRQLENHQ